MNNTTRTQRKLGRLMKQKTGKKIFASEQDENLAFDQLKPRSKGANSHLLTLILMRCSI